MIHDPYGITDQPDFGLSSIMDLWKIATQPGYDIHSSPWFFDGPNRNRWFAVSFTILNSMLLIFHGELWMS